MKIRRNVNSDELQDIAKKVGVNIIQHGDIIEIEGDEAEIDQAIHDIMELSEVEEDIDDGLLVPGNVINGDTSKKAYYKYKLIEYDGFRNRWLCDISEIAFDKVDGIRKYRSRRIGKRWVPTKELLEEHYAGRK